MQDLLTNRWLWSILLTALLFYPTRQLLWVMAVRRAERRQAQQLNEEGRLSLKRRMSITAGLLCFVFAVTYVHVMMANLYDRP
jgi:EamA domain-containing membrane protein RarD